MKAHLITLGIEPHQIIEEANGKFSIRGNVNWSGKLIHHEIPVALENVYGNFDVSHNQLKSLKNSPRIVLGIFNCCHNNLTSFADGPIACQNIRAIENPELMSLEFAPLWTAESQRYFEHTKIADAAKEIYHFACQKKCWDGSETWDQNMIRLYKAFPSECRKWNLLDSYFEPNRGAAAGGDLGIL
jgi:hypothetical protein